jgi:hypothetical protein
MIRVGKLSDQRRQAYRIYPENIRFTGPCLFSLLYFLSLLFKSGFSALLLLLPLANQGSFEVEYPLIRNSRGFIKERPISWNMSFTYARVRRMCG